MCTRQQYILVDPSVSSVKQFRAVFVTLCVHTSITHVAYILQSLGCICQLLLCIRGYHSFGGLAANCRDQSPVVSGKHSPVFCIIIKMVFSCQKIKYVCLDFDAVGWAAGRASGL